MTINKTYKHEFCMSCKQENPQNQAICKCGGRNYVFGDDVKFVGDKIVCDCGCEKFKMTFHMNCNPIYNATYQCKCGYYFGTQTYCES